MESISATNKRLRTEWIVYLSIIGTHVYYGVLFELFTESTFRIIFDAMFASPFDLSQGILTFIILRYELYLSTVIHRV